ncbi:hypothetical protein TNCV_2464071 [Trichonephila clavipes]|nr:hypothetical protein TNCV_2464071 [Trichonephila clavipes]
MDAMRLSIRLWGNTVPLLKSAISKSRTVAGGLGRAAIRHRRACPKHARLDSGQESMLAIPYAVLFQLQACSPPDELYAVGHYHPGKQRNLQWLQRNGGHEVEVSRLHTFSPSMPCPSIQEHVGCHTLRTESGLVCKQHLAPIMLLPISMFSPSSSGPYGGVGSTEWAIGLTCIEPSSHEADYILFGWTPFILLPRATVFATA